MLGVLNVYSKDALAFQADGMKVIELLADDAAFARLAKVSQNRNIRIRELAQTLIGSVLEGTMELDPVRRALLVWIRAAGVLVCRGR